HPPTPDAVGGEKTSTPQTGLRERHTAQPGTPPPHIRAGFASLPGSESAANRQRKARPIGSRLGHGSRHNRDRKAPPIELGLRHESAAHPPAIGNASAAQTARTTPHIDTTKPAAKEKSFRRRQRPTETKLLAS